MGRGTHLHLSVLPPGLVHAGDKVPHITQGPVLEADDAGADVEIYELYACQELGQLAGPGF